MLVEAVEDAADGAVDRVHADLGRVDDPRVLDPLHVDQLVVQGAAAGDVHQLGAAADPEHRDPRLQRRLDQGQLEGVATGVQAGRRRGRFAPVGAGVDVMAAGDDEAVDAGDDGHRIRLAGEVDG